MSLFNQKTGLRAILREIPDMELSRIAEEIRVDYYSKVLQAKLVFHLLLYGLLHTNKLGQRGLADVFASPMFRLLFRYEGAKEKISHSSLSERLSVINVDFFAQAYDCIYRRFSSLYTQKEIAGMYLQRVDSSLVKDCSGHLRQGLICGNEYKRGKQLKYTINFDGMFCSFGSVHSQSRYASESVALPENVMQHFKKDKEHACVYILDRGQSSVAAFKEMKGCKGLFFVGRLLANRKIKMVKDNTTTQSGTAFSHGELKRDCRVQLYQTVEAVGKNGKNVRKSVLVKETFRLVQFRPAGKDEDILLLTNLEQNITADQVASIYRRRWDIEVFFRFIKQELNFSHLLSLSENGIQVVLYMTLIAAMLVMIYKKENVLGYKTAVRRIGIEMEYLMVELVTLIVGGDMSKLKAFLPSAGDG